VIERILEHWEQGLIDIQFDSMGSTEGFNCTIFGLLANRLPLAVKFLLSEQ
jgi:hypothetical protein